MTRTARGGGQTHLPLASRRWRWSRVAAVRLMDLSGALRVWDRVANRRTPRILYYHNVHGPHDDITWCREPSLTLAVELFREHLANLRRHFRIVSLEEVVSDPAPDRVALTFDDGYRGVYEHVLPLLQQRDEVATVFLVTGRIGSSEVLWWDRLLGAVERLRSDNGMPDATTLLGKTWAHLLLEAPLEHLLDAYKQASGSERDAVDGTLAAFLPAKGASGRIFLSAEEIAALRRAGWTMGAHTVDHPLLPWLSDDELLGQLVSSRDTVLSLSGQTGCWFSYPDGTFGRREVEAVGHTGFQGAVQTGRRPEWGGRLALSRVGISAWAIASATGRYSPWRERWACARLTRSRLRALLRSSAAPGQDLGKRHA